MHQQTVETYRRIYKRWRKYLLLEELRSKSTKSKPIISASIGKISLTLEPLYNAEDHEVGFMYRDRPVNPNHGLLFLYNKPSYLSFWMKNVKFDIELLALDSHGRIAQIEYMISGDETPIQVKFPCSRVIEMPAGFCKSNNVRVGDVVRFNRT
jgi:uncharacterized membrane protein (UPF0127 family)